MNDDIKLIQGDCLELMKNIEAGSIDMILCDLPYGALSKQNKLTKWDAPIDLTALWKEYSRIIKPNGAIVLFGMEMNDKYYDAAVARIFGERN